MKKHAVNCLAKDENHFGQCPAIVGEYMRSRRMHHGGCVVADVDHLGSCLLERGKGSDTTVHASYCTLVDDLHHGPCRDEQGNWSKGSEITKDMRNINAVVADTELIGTTELKTWTPDSPLVEVNYHRPNGLSIQMSAEIPEDMSPSYRPDDALAYLSRQMEKMIVDIEEIQSSKNTIKSDTDPDRLPM
jgi:hypothetical protein